MTIPHISSFHHGTHGTYLSEHFLCVPWAQPPNRFPVVVSHPWVRCPHQTCGDLCMFFLCVCQLCTSYSWYLVSTWNQNIMTCWSYNIDLDMEASENRGTPQLSSIHTWIVHYKPSIFGYPLMESALDSCRPRRPEVAPSQRRWYLGSDRTLGFLSYFSYYPSDGITILTNDGITIISLVNG